MVVQEKICARCGAKFIPSVKINPDVEKQNWCGKCIAESFKGVYDVS